MPSEHGIPITQTKKKIYSQDRNLWHISHEGAEIEDPAKEPLEQVYTITVPVSKAPAKAEYVEIAFERGVPVAVNGKKYRSAGHELIDALNRLGGKHAVGQVTLVENRLVGMKSRGVYETPGGTILYEAHKALEQICLERDLYHYKQQLALQLRRAGLLRPVVPPAARGDAGVRRHRQPGRHRHRPREALQGARDRGQRRLSESSTTRSSRASR